MRENDCKLGWSELPPDLLILIGKRLSSRLCILRFRAVCRSWRSCCPLPSYRNILSPHFPRSVSDYTVVASAALVIQPLSGNDVKPVCWVVMVDEFEPGKLSIRYPLSKYRVLEPVEGSFQVLNVMDFRVTEVVTSYSLKPHDTLFVYCWNSFLDKLLLIPDLGICRDFRYLSSAMLDEDGYLSLFHYTCTIIKNINILQDRFEDIAMFNNRFYGINRRGKAFKIDSETFELNKISPAIPRAVSKRRKRIVVSDGDLYLVAMQKQAVGDCLRLKVYMLQEKEGKWIEVNRLDNRAFFVGADCSFSFPAEAYGLRDNCIYTYGNSFRRYCSKYGHGDHFIKSLYARENWIGVFCLEKGGQFRPMESCDVLWPPPPWLAPNSHVSGYLVGTSEQEISGFGALCKREEPELQIILQPRPHNKSNACMLVLAGGFVSIIILVMALSIVNLKYR